MNKQYIIFAELLLQFLGSRGAKTLCMAHIFMVPYYDRQTDMRPNDGYEGYIKFLSIPYRSVDSDLVIR